MSRFYAIVLVFLIGSLPVVSAYFGVGNFEVPGSTDVTNTDGDDIPDWFENLYWYNSTCRLNSTDPTDEGLDFDGDDFNNTEEFYYLFNPCLPNNDGDLDGLPDLWEDANGFDKFDGNDGLVDQDSDGLTNYYEYLNDTDMNNPDTDGDNMPDGWEVNYLLNPLDPADALINSDGDNLTNLQEYSRGTNPKNLDTDGDGDNDDVDICPIDPLNGCADDDLDGVSNENDLCPFTPTNETADINGCSISQRDTDGDGVNDLYDPCPTDASDSCVDTDNDTLKDYEDPCPEDPTNACVDSDNDGIPDNGFDGNPSTTEDNDACPTTPAGELVDATGCSLNEIDDDRDGVPNNKDPCPNDATDTCTDSDLDGVPDVRDPCPDDPTDGCVTYYDNASLAENATLLDNATLLEYAVVKDTAEVTGNAIVAGNATVSGAARVLDDALIMGTTIVTGNATIEGDSILTGDSKVAGNSNVVGSLLDDVVVFDSYINPSLGNNSKIAFSTVRNSDVVNNTDLQYVYIENLKINNNKIQPTSPGKIRVENVNFTISSSNMGGAEKDYQELVDGHTRSKDLTVNASGKTLKVSDEDTSAKFAEVKIKVQGSETLNVTVAKVSINPEGGPDLGNRYGHYLSVEDDQDLFSSLNVSNSTIKIYYDSADMNEAGEHNESTLAVAYYDAGTWRNVSFSKRGEDATGKYVLAKVDHFSIFGIFGDLLPCPITQKWCQYENDGAGGCISLLDSCEAPVSPISPAGGGGGAPKLTPPPIVLPVLQPEVTRLTDQLIMDLFIKRDWIDKDFWTVPISVAPALVLTDEPPSPISPIVRGLLAKPIKMLLEPLKVFRGEKVKSPAAISDIYRFTTEKVLAKYTQSDVVVIAVREPAVDSMAAVAYAKSQDAPILLTENDAAPEETIDAVKKLNPKKIVIVGGTVAISSAVESEFEKIAPTERIWGPTRYETAVELAEQLDPSMVVITDGEDPYQDAVIIAAEYKAPIIYVRGNEIPDSTREFLVKHIKTQEGTQMSWVTAGVDDNVHTEIQGLYSLPEFLTRNRLSLKLFQFGTRFLR